MCTNLARSRSATARPAVRLSGILTYAAVVKAAPAGRVPFAVLIRHGAWFLDCDARSLLPRFGGLRPGVRSLNVWGEGAQVATKALPVRRTPMCTLISIPRGCQSHLHVLTGYRSRRPKSGRTLRCRGLSCHSTRPCSVICSTCRSLFAGP